MTNSMVSKRFFFNHFKKSFFFSSTLMLAFIPNKLCCMGPSMPLQYVTVFECLVTIGAGKWLLSCVDPFMYFQMAIIVECLVSF